MAFVKPIQLVLFDMDGVLLNSKDNMRAAWAAVQRELHVTVPFEQYFERIGTPFAEIMNAIGLQKRATEASHIYFSASRQHDALLKWYPAVHELLVNLSLQGHKLGVVTSKDGSRARELLSNLPVAFDTVQTPTPGLRGKPAPDHILMACALTNTDPSETLFVGDMPVDYQAARRARVRFCHASWGYGEAPEGDCEILMHPLELLPRATVGLAA
jgi:HAD superfamily hydrolase (TIGR01549 family)